MAEKISKAEKLKYYNYRALRGAGFTSKQSMTYRNYNIIRIKNMIYNKLKK